jgi:UDP-N-acetylmuramoyl-tripeptide--D-alanyl-D-alanine ligase
VIVNNVLQVSNQGTAGTQAGGVAGSITLGNINFPGSVPTADSGPPSFARASARMGAQRLMTSGGSLSQAARTNSATNSGAILAGNQFLDGGMGDIGLLPGGTAVLPRDSEFFPRLAEQARTAGAARVIGFGSDPAAEVRLAEAGILRDGRTRAVVSVFGRAVEVTMPAMGLHHAGNACCALAMVAALGEDAARTAPALAAYAPGAGRGAPRDIRVAGGVATLIDESYNAAPPAMRAALRTLALRPGARRIAVLGDMRELGEFAAALHAGLAEDAARADLVFCCGPEMARLFALLPADRRGAHAADSAALAPIVQQALRPGDVVLVKGALGSRMALVVRALTESQT